MKRHTRFYAIMLIVFALTGFISCDDGTVKATKRTTTYGDVIGFEDDENSYAWLGIPYAKPPIGDLRWKASVPADQWTGTKKALAFCSECTQVGDMLASTATIFENNKTILGSEDCLYLNIWSPKIDADHIPTGTDRLPVMFWIHGGGNRAGFGGVDKGHKLASTQNVIVVMINYRLTSFGYFSHPAFRTATGDNLENTANFGVSDMILGLKWVQDNISSFGGDPDNVTIFGESAGGRNVMALVLSSEAGGLFHKAIVQSGGTDASTVAEAENYKDDPSPGLDYSSREVICTLLLADGMASDRNEAKAVQENMSNAQIAVYLRSKTKEQILDAYKDSSGKYIWPPTIVQDGYLIPKENVSDILSDTNRYNDVPMILGTNRDERKMFMVMAPEFVSWFTFTPGVTKDYYDAFSEWGSKLSKLRGVDNLARWFLSDPAKTDVYAYRFDWDEEGTLFGLMDLSTLLGAGHGIELNFVFGDFDYYHLSPLIFNASSIGADPASRNLLSDNMMSYWAQFAYTGNPGTGRPGETLPQWATWDTTEDADKFILLDTSEGGGIRMSPDEVTMHQIRDGIINDELLKAEDKCLLLKDLIVASPDYTEGMYPDNIGELCEDFPN